LIDGEVEWCSIKDFDGYEVSSDGNVRSLERITLAGHLLKGRVMKPGHDKDGYRQVSMRRDGHSYIRKVSRLVAEVFIGPRPSGYYVCHGPNGNQDDSRENIYYGTPVRNSQDKLRDGTYISGSAAYQAKINEEQAKEILERASLGENPAALGRAYGLSRSATRYLIMGRSWKHIERPDNLPITPRLQPRRETQT
jgi:hypothetical protein